MLLLDIRQVSINTNNVIRASNGCPLFDERNLPSEIYRRGKFLKEHRVKRSDEYTEEERKERAEALLSGRKTAEQLVEYVEIEEELEK